MGKIKNKRKGITLIALIITVVVLLILAGITINLTIGQDGILRRASETGVEYEKARLKEEMELAILDIRTEKLLQGKSMVEEDLLGLEKIGAVIENIDIPTEGEYKGYYYVVDSDFKVTILGKVTGILFKYNLMPKEYTNSDIKLSINVSSTDGEITKLQEPNNITKNEYGTYTITSNGNYQFYIEDSAGNTRTSQVKVQNIDKLEPLDFTPKIQKNGGNITVEDNAEDAEADEINVKSGIDYCKYYLKFENETEYTEYETSKIENLETGEYELYVVAYDKAGNSKKSNIVEFKVIIPFSKISSGYKHVLALDEEGNLYGWGDNSQNQLGISNISTAYEPVKIPIGVKVKEIATGTEYGNGYSLVIDEEGNLWAWGDNSYGQMGNGSNTIEVKKPRKITVENVKFKEVSAGNEHCLALDEEGNIWSWGNNSMGRLGNGNTTDVYKPKKIIVENVKFKQISAGSNHSLAIDEYGNLWSWGNNSSYQLGYSNSGSNYNVTEPKKVEIENTKFEEVCAANSCSLLLDENNDLWVCGYNYHGELGDGTVGGSHIKELKKIVSNGKFIKCSEIHQHGLMLDNEGNIWSWGYNGVGQLGSGDTTDILVPTQINIENVQFKQIAAGSLSSYAIDMNGNLWSWGSDTYGALGNGDAKSVKIPTMLE